MDTPTTYRMPVQTMTFPAGSELARLLFGGPDVVRPPTPMSVRVDSTHCPVVAPRKRRGLTGKRYRIARRGYARDMRRWHRGEIAPLRMRHYLPRVTLGVDQARDGSSAVTIIGTIEVDPCPHLGGTADCPADHLQIYGGVFAGRVWTGQDIAGQPRPDSWFDEVLDA